MTFKEKLFDPSARIVVAIDGVAASGKGTLAKLMAKKFHLVHCQTSLFYRQLAYNAIKAGIQDDNDKIIALSSQPMHFNNDDLYSAEVTDLTSKIAAIPEVRANLTKPQRDFLVSNQRVVMEGRDIGTVIVPDADLKIFITADVRIRAERRLKQLQDSGKDGVLEDIIAAINERDERDSTRAASPLQKAKGAIEVDSSSNSPEEIVELMCHSISE